MNPLISDQGVKVQFERLVCRQFNEQTEGVRRISNGLDCPLRVRPILPFLRVF